MSNPNKAKGTRLESGLVRVLSAFWRRRFGLDPYRPAQSGARDVGDINGVSPFVIQCKDYRDVTAGLREGLDGAEKQKVNAGEPYGVAVVKRARKPLGESYAVMSVATFARLLLRLRRAEALLADEAPSAFAHHAEETRRDLEEEFPR